MTAEGRAYTAASNAFENAQITVDDLKQKLKAKIEQCRKAIQESKKAEVMRTAANALAELDTYGTGALIADFEAANPEIDIQFTNFDHEAYKNAIRNFLTADPPDVGQAVRLGGQPLDARAARGRGDRPVRRPERAAAPEPGRPPRGPRRVSRGRGTAAGRRTRAPAP